MLDEFPAVQEFLEVYRVAVTGVLGGNLVGIYLQGSLALGDFNPETSDIDLVVVTTDNITDSDRTRLAAMHESLPPSPTYGYEVSYMTAAAARHPDPADCEHLQFDGTRLKAEPQGYDAIILRYVTREMGIFLQGLPAEDLFAPVLPSQLWSAAERTLREWWQPMLDPASSYHELVAADPLYQTYAILTMCRARYSIAFDTVVSKTTAADWALEVMESRWHPLIKQALLWRPGTAAQDGAQALAFVAEVVAAEIG